MEGMRKEKPKWLTEEFIKKSLEYGNDFTITIESMLINMPIPEGSNYVCDIFGVKIEYRKSNDLNNLYKKSFIIKSPILGKRFEGFKVFGVLEKEFQMYNEFSPKLNKIYGVNDDQGLLAKSYFSTEKDVLILEDLKLKGYKMVDRVNQLDFKHCILVLKALAKFHAGSVIIHDEDPKLIEEKVGIKGMFTKDNITKSPLENFFSFACEQFNEVIENRAELNKYSKYFNGFGKINWSNFLNIIKRNDDEFNVLNHGDLWVSNIMFKYNENNEPINVILIDLQLCRYASPAYDFLLFIDTSAQENIKFEKFEELIDTYINELNLNLKKFGNEKNLSVKQFKNILNDKSVLRVYGSAVFLPVVTADPDTTEFFDFNDLPSDDLSGIGKNPLKTYYYNEKYLSRIKNELETLERYGIIKTE